MAVVNAITGKRRRRPRRQLPRKKRATMASTVACEMYAQEAMQAFDIFMAGARLHLAFLSLIFASGIDLDSPQTCAFYGTVLLGGSYLFSCAMNMLKLDSSLMDLSDEDVQNAGYETPLVGITLEFYENDDECQEKCRFSKADIKLILAALPCGKYVQVYYHRNKYYKFLTEELLIYSLRRMSTARTHKDLCDNEFGGCPKCWGLGYNWLVKVMDKRFKPLIGPQAVRLWVHDFPKLAESIREYMERPRIKKD